MSIAQLRDNLADRIRHGKAEQFDALALEVFQYQAAHNELYRSYLQLLGKSAAMVTTLEDIPCLPIAFFKQYLVQSGQWTPQSIFTSSGTTGNTTSRHALRDATWYRDMAQRGFEHFYGSLPNYAILALLPAYLERSGSSLVYMVDHFIQQSVYPESGFFLHNVAELVQRLQALQDKGIPTLLIGVSFALLDIAEKFPVDLSNTMVMETGGMKGRRKEITRAELHHTLQKAFGVAHIHSEYGMTELLSQAYSQEAGRFWPAPSMRVFIRDITDPFTYQAHGRTGALNIIDLANLDTISFIATDDLGKAYPDGSFTVLGRLDASDIRGCNLLVF